MEPNPVERDSQGVLNTQPKLIIYGNLVGIESLFFKMTTLNPTVTNIFKIELEIVISEEPVAEFL